MAGRVSVGGKPQKQNPSRTLTAKKRGKPAPKVASEVDTTFLSTAAPVAGANPLSQRSLELREQLRKRHDQPFSVLWRQTSEWTATLVSAHDCTKVLAQGKGAEQEQAFSDLMANVQDSVRLMTVGGLSRPGPVPKKAPLRFNSDLPMTTTKAAEEPTSPGETPDKKINRAFTRFSSKPGSKKAS